MVVDEHFGIGRIGDCVGVGVVLFECVWERDRVLSIEGRFDFGLYYFFFLVELVFEGVSFQVFFVLVELDGPGDRSIVVSFSCFFEYVAGKGDDGAIDVYGLISVLGFY